MIVRVFLLLQLIQSCGSVIRDLIIKHILNA